MDGSEIQFHAAKIYESQPPTIRRFSLLSCQLRSCWTIKGVIVRCDKSDLLTWLQKPTNSNPLGGRKFFFEVENRFVFQGVGGLLVGGFNPFEKY